MGVYVHRRLRVAYVFWPIPVLTPRWFDDNDWTRMHDGAFGAEMAFGVWCWMRAHGLIRVRYWGRA